MEIGFAHYTFECTCRMLKYLDDEEFRVNILGKLYCAYFIWKYCTSISFSAFLHCSSMHGIASIVSMFCLENVRKAKFHLNAIRYV